MQKSIPVDFDDYARQFPDHVRGELRRMRSTIRKAAPKAAETISYNLPAFAVDGKALIWFAAFNTHIGFYPGAAAIAKFRSDLCDYKTAKGSIQFPLDRSLPLRLIERIVKFKVRNAPA